MGNILQKLLHFTEAIQINATPYLMCIRKATVTKKRKKLTEKSVRPTYPSKV